MESPHVSLAALEERTIYGLLRVSCDRTISKDIPKLSKEYKAVLGQKGALPFFVLSRNYREKDGVFELLIGGLVEKPGLTALILPAGEYAKITVQPKLGFLWGAAIGEAKRFFYTQWLPASPYRPLNLEYECHTEKSVGRHPSIDLYFAVTK